MGIAEKDLNLLNEAVIEVAEKTLGKITSRETNWMTSITTKVNHLAETIEGVCNTMQVESYGVDSVDTLTMPILLPPLRITISV